MKSSDLRGAARLATDATAGLVDLVEAMHERIARLPGSSAAPGGRTGGTRAAAGGRTGGTRAAAGGRTGGITGVVYKTVRGVTRVVGGSVDALLAALAAAWPQAAAADDAPAATKREAWVAALNGVLGDHLAATANPLAVTMALRQDGRALQLERDALAQRLAAGGAAPAVLVVALHGLCMNDLQWRTTAKEHDHDHAAMLARELHGVAVYLHYNTGLPVAANGGACAALLETLLAQWPGPPPRVVLLGHSMGGLVVRSALHQAAAAGQHWPAHVSDAVFIGTPHHGAPLERAGHWIDTVLGATPYAAPLARLGKLRSAGITDLRHGQVLASAEHVPLPPQLRCFAVAGSTGQHAGALKHRLLGDGLVPLASALGQHHDATRALAFGAGHTVVAWGVGHLALLSDAGVAARLRSWVVAVPPALA